MILSLKKKKMCHFLCQVNDVTKQIELSTLVSLSDQARSGILVVYSRKKKKKKKKEKSLQPKTFQGLILSLFVICTIFFAFLIVVYF